MFPKNLSNKKFDFSYSSDKPIISIAIPVFNQSKIITRNLVNLIKCVELKSEIILINDASEDDTLCVLENFVKNTSLVNYNITRICLVSNRVPRFETNCDIQGINLSEGKYVLEVQADLLFLAKGFDKRMLAAIQSDKNIFLASGRGVHSFDAIRDGFYKSKGSDISQNKNPLNFMLSAIALKLYNQYFKKNEPNFEFDKKTNPIDLDTILPNLEKYKIQKFAGRLGITIEQELSDSDYLKNHMWLGETVMRGPLLIDKQKYHSVGGLDGGRLFQGFDDHDLALRGYLIFGYRCCFVPV